MGYGILEMKCPQGHVWNTEWCSHTANWISPLSTCPKCGEQGANTQKNVLAELMAKVEKAHESGS